MNSNAKRKKRTGKQGMTVTAGVAGMTIAASEDHQAHPGAVAEETIVEVLVAAMEGPAKIIGRMQAEAIDIIAQVEIAEVSSGTDTKYN
jgi:hypothetical protein